MAARDQPPSPLHSQVMQTLADAPTSVELALARTLIVREEKKGPPLLEIVGGNSGECQQGVILRTAIQSSKSELYRGMAKVCIRTTNVPSGCGTCHSNVVPFCR